MSADWLTVTVSVRPGVTVAEVAAQLRAAGAQVEESLETLGVLVGRVPAAGLAAVRDLDGVAAVEPARTFRLAPPDSDVQ